MSHQEFCTQVAPMIKELEEEYQKMDLKEFLESREKILKSAVVEKDFTRRFMAAVLDMIQKKVFGEESANKTAY